MAPPATRPDASEEPFPLPPGVPDSLIPRSSHATTEPAPEAIADVILARLQPSIDNIYARLDALLLLRERDAARLKAIDNGVGSAHMMIGQLEEKSVATLDAARNACNASLEAVAQCQQLRAAIAEQTTFDKTRLASAELRIDGAEERIERLEARTGG
jgi:hypothetical protein